MSFIQYVVVVRKVRRSEAECNLYIWKCSLTLVFAPFFDAFFFDNSYLQSFVFTFYRWGITVGACCTVFVSVLNTTNNTLDE